MKRLVYLSLAFLLLLSSLRVASFAERVGSSITPSSLRCEYLVSPLAIDTREPRLSWMIESNVRGARQTAYQIIVSGTAAKTAANEGDLWDTGKVASSQTIQIAYQGRPLNSLQQCFWKVRTWDQNNKPSSWSKPAQWTMGLMESSDWSAQWIGDKLASVENVSAGISLRSALRPL